jgi:hypothetical protein
VVQYKFTNDDENFWCNVVLNLYLSNNILIKFRFSIKKKKKRLCLFQKNARSNRCFLLSNLILLHFPSLDIREMTIAKEPAIELWDMTMGTTTPPPPSYPKS